MRLAEEEDDSQGRSPVVLEAVGHPRGDQDGIPGGDLHLVVPDPHPSLTLRKVVNLLQGSLFLVGVGAFAGPRIEFPDVEARPQTALAVEKGPYSNGAPALVDTLHSPDAG